MASRTCDIVGKDAGGPDHGLYVGTEGGRLAEADISAEPPAPEQDPWLPGQNADSRGPACVAPETAQGQAPPDPILGPQPGVPGTRTGRRAARLSSRAEFSRVYREGRRYSGEALVLYFRPSAELRRVGVTAGRRLGGAVVRNRAKRRLREAFRRLEGRLCVRGDVVLVARSQAGMVPFATLVSEMEALCEAGRLLSRDP